MSMFFFCQIELEDDDTKDIFTFDFSHWVGEVKGDCRKELPVLRLGKGQKQSKFHIYVIFFLKEDFL